MLKNEIINCSNLPGIFSLGNKYQLDLNKPIIMGILNVTPDSFSDGGKFNNISSALYQAEKMIKEGADIIDIGGESTRPGASPVTFSEELDRVIPVIEKISENFDIPISLDTSSPEVMEEGVKKGACLINDVRALTKEGALEKAANLKVPVCLMHMQGNPENMQQNPGYKDVICDIISFLKKRISACLDIGITKNKIILDPGFGFGKKLEHNLSILKNLNSIKELGYPVLVGISKKAMFNHLLGLQVDERIHASVSANLIAYLNGGNIFRVHDVAPNVHALKFAMAVKNI